MPLASSAMPLSTPIWLRTTLAATPLRKPTRIGFDRKSAIAPSFAKLAPTHIAPARKVSVIASDR